MKVIKTYPMQQSTVLRINAERDNIDTQPAYQRNGDLWDIEKRQLLIDSILNEYDIPKLYFHLLDEKGRKINSSKKDYAIIDGRQRLETIWSFIDGKFKLSDDFDYFKDPEIKASSLSYEELAKRYPKLKIIFDSFVLPIILVETDDIDVIEDMFSRLNEAVTLTAAEKRNAFGGSMAKIIRDISAHQLFKHNLKISNKRYQHREIAARLLFLISSLKYSGKIYDTKKVFLDEFVKEFKGKTKKDSAFIKKEVVKVLNEMSRFFHKKDSLLNNQAVIPIYFLLFKEAIEKKKTLVRTKFLGFNQDRLENRKIAEKNISKANYDLLEYDRMSQQGTNDASSIKERLRILQEYLKV